MTTEQTAQQFELAAQILRTGHPWEWQASDGEWVKPTIRTELHHVISDGLAIRLAFATPPDGRPLHNPDNLTAEQVGVGYRLLTTEEIKAMQSGKKEYWSRVTPGWSGVAYPTQFSRNDTYRLPLSVPWPEPADPYAELKEAHVMGRVIQYRSLNCPEWQDQRSISWNPPDAPYKPEYRIKPTESAKPEPTFQLPPPPPGMQWHRTDGWKEGDLPQGWRPLVEREKRELEDEWTYNDGNPWRSVRNFGPAGAVVVATSAKHRTRRPLTFTHAGKTWTWHRPGDPMPITHDKDIYFLRSDLVDLGIGKATSRTWDTSLSPDRWIIGWRYADEKKIVPLGPEDVLPGSVFRWPEWPKFHWKAIRELDLENVYFCAGIGDTHGSTTASYELLKSDKAEINRSIPLTGRWNPDAWEPCSKEFDA